MHLMASYRISESGAMYYYITLLYTSDEEILCNHDAR